MVNLFDINVNDEELSSICSRIERINEDLITNTQKMCDSLTCSKEYLEGERFNEVEESISKCVRINQLTSENLRKTIEYLKKLQEVCQEQYHLFYPTQHILYSVQEQ